MIANLPRFLKRNRTAPIHFSPRDAIGTTSGTPTGARAAGDVGPYHAPRHVRTRTPRAAHARHARRTRTPCAHLVGRDVLGAPRPRDDIGDAHEDAGRRGRRPLPRSAPHPHTHTARRTRTPCAHLVGRDVPGAPRPRNDIGNATGARAAGDVGPYHAPRHIRTRTSRAAHARHVRTRTPCAHLVRRDVLGAPLPTRTPSGTPTGTRAAGDVGPYHAPRHVRTRASRAAHARHVRTRTPCAHLVGRDVLGAPLSTERHRGRPRARGPPGTSAPTTHRAMSAHAHRAPHTHAMRAPGRARRPRRAAPTGRPRDDIGDAHGDAGRRGRRPLPRSTPHPHGRARRPRRAAPTGRPRNDIGDAHGHAGRRDVGPYHALRHVRTRTSRAAHARHVRTRAPCLPCQRIETLMGFRNAAAKSRTRACHAFASFTAPAPLQVAPAQ